MRVIVVVVIVVIVIITDGIIISAGDCIESCVCGGVEPGKVVHLWQWDGHGRIQRSVQLVVVWEEGVWIMELLGWI